MESFFRYISYIEYYEEGKKKHTSGYIIWRYQLGRHRVEIHLKDFKIKDKCLEIMEESSGINIGEIMIERGTGDLFLNYPVDDGTDYIMINDKKLYLEEITGFKLLLESDDILYVKINLPVEKRRRQENNEERVNTEEVSVQIKEEKGTGPEKVSERNVKEEVVNSEKKKDMIDEKTEDKVENKDIEKTVDEKTGDNNEEIEKKEHEQNLKNFTEQLKEEAAEKEDKEVKPEKSMKVREAKATELKDEEIQILRPMEEEKWKQLCRTYSVVHPFPARQEFISLTPQDFIILQESYQRLVHNSFLLHGYYNYGHLILGKLSEGTEEPYYIGVPGVYYEREKRAAKMFGFIGFECADRIIENGSYGYYMIEVKI